MSEILKYADEFFMVIGVLRVVNKPLFTLLREYVNVTPDPKDNEILDRVEKSKFYSAFLFALDWLASVKIKKP